MARLLRGTLARLVVVDYAETRLEAVRFLVGRLARANEKPRLRLVLLARRAEDWWENLGTDSATKHLLASAHQDELPLLLPDLEQRRRVFRTAVHAFTPHLLPRAPAIPNVGEGLAPSRAGGPSPPRQCQRKPPPTREGASPSPTRIFPRARPHGRRLRPPSLSPHGRPRCRPGAPGQAGSRSSGRNTPEGAAILAGRGPGPQ
jgi:hypothetical protein